MADFAADKPDIKSAETVNRLNRIPVLYDLAIFNAPGIGDIETYFVIAAVFLLGSRMRVENDIVAVDMDMLDIVGVFRKAFGKFTYICNHPFKPIRNTSLVWRVLMSILA